MSDRAEVNRKNLRDAVTKRPFVSFWIRLESGDRLDVKHPELVAFDPEFGGSTSLLVVTRSQNGWTSLDAMTGLAAAVGDEQPAGGSGSEPDSATL